MNTKKVPVTKKSGIVYLTQEEYIEDNLIYHSMVHSLHVAMEKLDLLEEKGYIFRMLKQKANHFRDEVFKHTGSQIKMMNEMGSADFLHHTQNDYEFITDFFIKANPAQITFLTHLIRENERLRGYDEKELVKSLESGEIKVKPETKI